MIGKQIAGVGEFTAHYNAFGDIVSQTLPTGVVQASSYDRSGQETSLTYTVTGDEGEASFAWTIHHDALGRINQISGPGGDGDRVTRYEFDQAARMTAAYDQIADTCVTRDYEFDVVGRRTGQVTKTQSCTDAGTPSTSSKTWSYDKADRLLSGANGVGEYVYDALGRQTSLPSVDTPHGESAGDLAVSYYDSDLARSVTQDGVTTTYDLDVMDRRSTSTTIQGSDTSTTTRVYEDTSDNPAWAKTVTGSDTKTTRYVSSIAGDLSLTYSVEDEFLSTGIVDPQGSVVATTSKQQVVDGAAATVWSGLSLFDEYGNPVTGKSTDTGALDYGWLGGKERATDISGLVLMGVRLYNSVTGHFTSVDPVKGGNTTRYTYPQDPVNQCDISGLNRAACNTARKTMENIMDRFYKKQNELYKDSLKLPLTKPERGKKGTVQGHISQILGYQAGLKNAMDDFHVNRCNPKYGMRMPKGVKAASTAKLRLNPLVRYKNGKLTRVTPSTIRGRVGGVAPIGSSGGTGRPLAR